MSTKGSCFCGTVKYEIAGSFETVGNCHCSMCRKSHGAAFVTWGIINPEHFRWTAGEDFVQAYQSSAGRQRCFCKKCGSPLAAMHSGAVGEVVFGNVDGDSDSRPSEHIFVGSKAPWYDITDPLPQHEGWPPGFQP